jgi:hypothetical protein
MAKQMLDHEPLCDQCAIHRLIKEVERLKTGYVTIDAEIRYEV